MKSFLSISSAVISAFTLFAALFFFAINSHDGLLPDLGLWLSAWTLGIGNTLVLGLNMFRWWLFGAPSWVKSTAAVQAIPALICLWLLGHAAYSEIEDSKAFSQRSRIVAAIQADEPDRWLKEQGGCERLCQERYTLNEQLLDASQSGSIKVANTLIARSAKVSSKLGEPGASMYTCDGLYLPDNDALSVAVARNDLTMARLLWPVSDPGSRRRALWIAAQTDRIGMVQWLARMGVPLDIRGGILDQNDTLLVAAASGGVLQVGQWLIESRHMPVNAILDGPDPYAGRAPVAELYRFMQQNNVTPQATALLKVLVAHGANIDVPLSSRPGDRPLADAVHIGNKAIVRLLLDTGANTALLDDKDRADLQEVLAKPDDSSRLRDDCIHTGLDH